MSKLKKQFWYYGVIPILILYFFALHFWGQNLILGFNDCLPNRSCSDFFMSELERSQNFVYIISIIIFSWTIWNSYRVFQISKTNQNKKIKIISRISVVICPLIALILFPFLALELARTPSYLMNFYYDLWVYILQSLGGSPGKFGMGYYIANIMLFVIIKPLLIIIFFWLWIKQRKQNTLIQSKLKLEDQ
tara:strand:- start:7457 stop:8029 length:573 start_codon:yes stop_codon:yes gene_type:complete